MQTRFGVDPYPGFYDNQRLFECTFAVALEQSTWAPPIASRSSERRDQMGGEEAFSFMPRFYAVLFRVLGFWFATDTLRTEKRSPVLPSHSPCFPGKLEVSSLL